MESFSYIVKTILNKWTALQLAIQHGMGGANAKEKEIWMAEDVVEYFQKNDNLYPDEVEDLLLNMLDQDFNTVVEDGSALEVSKKFCECFELCSSGKEAEALATLPSNANFSVELNQSVPGADSTDMETDSSPAQEMNNLSLNQRREDNHSDDEGWTVVGSKHKGKM